jgi:hypothetical protein
MDFTMKMGNNEMEYRTADAEYGDEILCAGWNPVVDAVYKQLQLEQTAERLGMPESLTAEIAEVLLRKMYSYPF